MTHRTADINNDDSDGLQYINDVSSGMNTSPNSRLLVGPVDETDNQSSYQCIFVIGLDDFESSIGTLTVTGTYAGGSIKFNVDTCSTCIICYVTYNVVITVGSHCRHKYYCSKVYVNCMKYVS